MATSSFRADCCGSRRMPAAAGHAGIVHLLDPSQPGHEYMHRVASQVATCEHAVGGMYVAPANGHKNGWEGDTWKSYRPVSRDGLEFIGIERPKKGARS